jgi:hypothetical protein
MFERGLAGKGIHGLLPFMKHVANGCLLRPVSSMAVDFHQCGKRKGRDGDRRGQYAPKAERLFHDIMRIGLWVRCCAVH